MNLLSLLFLYAWFFVAFWQICFKKRNFDSLSIYFVFLTLFFIPIFFGKVFDPTNDVYVSSNSLLPVVGGIAYFGLMVALFLKKEKIRAEVAFSMEFSGRSARADYIFLLLGVATCVFLTAQNIGSLTQAGSKVEVLEGAGATYILLTALVPVVFACAYSMRRWWVALLAFAIACLLFVFGSRRTLAILFLIWIYWGLSGQTLVLARKFGYLAIGVFLLLLVVLGKSFYGYFLVYGWDGIGLWWGAVDMRSLSSGAEFLSTSAILHYVVERDFAVPLWAVPVGILSALPIPLSYFGLSSSLFNDLFQGILFPGIAYEMAYNPWAEAYSWLGVVGVGIYAVAIPVSLLILERLFHSMRSRAKSAILLTMMVYLAFWVHRNSFGSELAYLRNIFFPSAILYAISLVLAKVSLR